MQISFVKGTIEPLIKSHFLTIKSQWLLQGKLTGGKNAPHSLGVAGISKGYFNSGFLLINTAKWAAQQVSARAIAMLNEPEVIKKITHPDQDVLNMLLADKYFR